VLLQPLSGARAAAGRTVTVPAPHEGEVPLSTAGTGPTGPPRRGGMTRFDIAHGLELVAAHARVEACAVFLSVGAKDLAQNAHSLDGRGDITH